MQVVSRHHMTHKVQDKWQLIYDDEGQTQRNTNEEDKRKNNARNNQNKSQKQQEPSLGFIHFQGIFPSPPLHA